jgi:hypothetical protein
LFDASEPQLEEVADHLLAPMLNDHALKQSLAKAPSLRVMPFVGHAGYLHIFTKYV